MHQILHCYIVYYLTTRWGPKPRLHKKHHEILFKTTNKTTQSVLTWLVGSPNRLHMWGTILLRVKPWAPYLKKSAMEKKLFSLFALLMHTVNKHADWMTSDTHIFSVEIRQKQTASLDLLFLCLNPPNIRSHTYWKRQMV